MPELPEVETTTRGINKKASNLTIIDVWTSYYSNFYAGKDDIKNPEFFKKFKKKIIGSKITNAFRRAKNILINLSSGNTVLIHMKMTGHVMYGKYKKVRSGEWIVDSEKKYDPLKDPFNRFIRLVFSLSNGKHLVLCDMRRFAKVTLIESSKLDHSPHLSHLGVEPLAKNFSSKIFGEQLLKRPKAKIKQALLDQTLVVGIGNIYSDEALWRANINPERKVESLSKTEIKTLYRGVIRVLKNGIDFGGDSMSDYRNIDGLRGSFQEKHEAYRKTGKMCRKKGCKGKITRKIIGGRSSHFCPIHQK